MYLVIIYLFWLTQIYNKFTISMVCNIFSKNNLASNELLIVMTNRKFLELWKILYLKLIIFPG